VTQPVSLSQTKASVIGALLVALGPISMALYTPAMPTLVRVFDTDVSAVKLTLTLYFLGFAFAQLICGPMSDAWGRRPVVIGFTTLYLAGSLLAVFSPSIEWLLLARVVQGFGAASGAAISRAIVRDLYTGRQSVQVMNLIGLFLMAGPALSPTLGGLTLDFLGWHAIFMLMVIYGIVIILVFWMLVPETLRFRDPVNLRPRRLAANYLTLVRDPRFLRPSMVMACSVGCLYTLATVLPFVLIDGAGLSPLQFGLGMMAQSGSFVFGSLIMRRLLRRVEAHRMVPFGLVLIGAGALLLPISAALAEPSFITVMTPIGVLALGIPFVMPTMMTESLAPFPHIAGAASALAGFFQMGAGLLGSALAAAIGQPILALATVAPALAMIAVATHVALKGYTSRMEEAVADRIIHPTAPAE
jgi:DHA1 family bicyclomycin/chloramphenicol resistance-like MFS transporter